MAAIGHDLPQRHLRDQAPTVLLEIPGVIERQNPARLVEDLDGVPRRRLAFGVEVLMLGGLRRDIAGLPANGQRDEGG